jgi:L-fuconolactonase
VQEEPDPRWLCRADVRRALTAVGDAGLVYDLLVTPRQLAAAIETVRTLPDVRFVLDHAGKPAIADGALEPWRTDLAALAAAPNVAVKLSGLVTETAQDWTLEQLRPYTEALLEAFGPERIMFGSDWPVCLLAASYDEVFAAAQELTAGLSAAERIAVFGGTAAFWCGIVA